MVNSAEEAACCGDQSVMVYSESVNFSAARVFVVERDLDCLSSGVKRGKRRDKSSAKMLYSCTLGMKNFRSCKVYYETATHANELEGIFSRRGCC